MAGLLAAVWVMPTLAGSDDHSQAAPEVWALRPIAGPPIPTVMDRTRINTAVDAFIQAKLESRGLSLAPEAERRALLRRLKFDLHGLPPTPRELDEFVGDPAPDAYDRLVDRLLDSPHYGERWARHWLDVVRFAESNGYERDRIRENSWRYRDWVIEAFNRDLPFRDFVRAQVAGDAANPDDPDGAVPTGFLVTGPNNDVGNQSTLELMRERSDELDEIVQNVSSVFLGLTVGCARCHDHKFDPIPMLDYYRMAAVFSGVKFGDRPLLAARQAEILGQRITAWDARLKEINQQLSSLEKELDLLGGQQINARRNEERFDAVVARFVRFSIAATRDGSEPCLDEVEIHGFPLPATGPDGKAGSQATIAEENLALASRGAKATASSLLPGYPIHQIHHLNDGRVGNSHSWISQTKGTGWAQIELAGPAMITRVVWGRDREGQFTDRLASEYRLECSMDGQSFRPLPTLQERPGADPEIAVKLAALNGDRQKLQAEKKEIGTQRAEIERLPKTWAALSTPPVPLKVLKRGDVLTSGEDAPPGALSAVPLGLSLHAVDIGIPPNAADPARRLRLADWIADEHNPLTWRVIVNRVWHYHFGAGLVTTPSDFGTGGSRPSHPELLDWLAHEFRSGGGHFKALHRMIVRSAVYRQAVPVALGDDHVTHAISIDGDNRLLWRPNRHRLDAEALRDSIRFVAGTLDTTLFGPSYRPFHYIEGNIPVYEPLEEGPETRRRTIYRHIVRTHRQPFLDTFDCPDPSVMTPSRTQTTTPLQALSLLNNMFVLEQADCFAERVTFESGSEPASQVRHAFRLALVREPSGAELEAAVEFVGEHGLGSLCRVLFNSNEFLYVE